MVFQAAVFQQEEAEDRVREKTNPYRNHENNFISRCSAVGSRPVWAGPASAASGGFSAAGPGAAVADFERLFREEGSGYRKRATKAERTKKPNQHHK